MKPALVVLAAGASKRLGRCKALVEFRGESVLAHHLRAGSSLDGVPPLLITGAHDEELRGAAPSGCHVAFNANWDTGRSSGILLAHKLRLKHALLIAPVDVPLVPSSVFEALTHAWARAGAPERGWLSPRYIGSDRTRNGKFGHPVIVGPALASDLARFPSDTPLRAFRDFARPLFSVDTDRDEILLDLDTPADLEAIRARLE